MLHILECFFDELKEDVKDQVMDPRKCERTHTYIMVAQGRVVQLEMESGAYQLNHIHI